jgi:branched-chain amino acid transport system substrate-binding protein
MIGHISPLTGDEAIYGKWEKDGIDLAVDEINAGGGISGRKIAVIHEDDKSSAATAISALQSLISARDVRVVIGGSLSSTTLAMAPIAEQHKVILLTPSAQSPKISQAGDFVFRLFASSTVEGAQLAALVAKSGVSTAAIIYNNNDYGVGLRDVITEKLRGHVNVLAAEAYAGETKDFRTQIQKAVVSTKPDAVILLGYPADMGTALKQMAEMGVHPRVFAPNGFEGEEIVKIAGQAAEGVVYVYPILSDSQNAVRVKEAFRARYGHEMNVYNGMGYDSLKVLAAAIENAFKATGKLDGDPVKDALYHTQNFPGVTGPITFDQNGDVVDRPMEARVVRNGKFITLKE